MDCKKTPLFTKGSLFTYLFRSVYNKETEQNKDNK